MRLEQILLTVLVSNLQIATCYNMYELASNRRISIKQVSEIYI